MAKEYIEREALLADFGEPPMVWTDSEEEIQERLDWYRYKGIVESQPAADVVEVGMLSGMLSELENKCFGDGVETYTTGYRNGHRNGQIELLRYILRVPEGTSEDARMDGEG